VKPGLLTGFSYAEGRRYWAQLILASQTLGRVFWVHTKERPECQDRDMLAKLSAMNLLVAYAVALKHKLRYEPYTGYDDLNNLVGHLDTLASAATRDEPENMVRKKPNVVKSTGEYLGFSFAASNPRKAIKKARRPLGNLPLEILSYLASYVDECVANGQLPVPMQQTLAYNNIAALNDVLTGTERVLTTPLPIAYAIAISQITWVYVMLLPFQLVTALEWVTIPGTIAAAYIILGILFIGREIENPFGQDVNDLPLESYCQQIATELDVIASRRKPNNKDWIETLDNKVLFPLSTSGWPVWMHRGEAKVRDALLSKTEMGFEQRREAMAQDEGKNEPPRRVSKDEKQSAANGETAV
jgi:ion channel-forming bestrophin family protein